MENKKAVDVILKSLTIIFAISAVLTLLPYSGASEKCVLGYRALCSFSPVSAVILAVAAHTTHTLRKRRKGG